MGWSLGLAAEAGDESPGMDVDVDEHWRWHRPASGTHGCDAALRGERHSLPRSVFENDVGRPRPRAAYLGRIVVAQQQAGLGIKGRYRAPALAPPAACTRIFRYRGWHLRRNAHAEAETCASTADAACHLDRPP